MDAADYYVFKLLSTKSHKRMTAQVTIVERSDAFLWRGRFNCYPCYALGMLRLLILLQSDVRTGIGIAIPILLVIGLIFIVYLLFDIRSYLKELAETD